MPSCGVTEYDDMRIPMRDGVVLSARVWMPATAAQAPSPAILEILPYRKRDGTVDRDATTHAQFAQHGYVCLRVDLRGTGESEGLFEDEYCEQELCDVEDTLAWISKQTWCSGAVGMMGISWGGFNGLQVAARRPDALKAVISMCSTTDRYADDIHYKGGCQLTENVGWATEVMSWFSMPPDPAIVGDSWRKTWLHRLENTPFLIRDWLKHSNRDDYWKHGSVCEDFSQIEAPVLVLGGWHDGYRNTAAKLLEAETSGPVKAIMGPWNHRYPHIATPSPRMDFVAECLQWWDRWLKGTPNAVDTMPDYRAYVMDGIAPQRSYEHRPGRWVAFDNWPLRDVSETVLKLGQGTLGNEAMAQPASVETHAICGRKCGEYFPYGFEPGELPDDQREDDALSLCFDGDALDAPLTVFGAPSVQLRLASNKAYGQCVARLCDVAPDGASTLISFGILNLQHRNGFEQLEPLTPNEVYEVNLTLDQAAYVVPLGHHLRLAVSPSYWPYIWPERGAVDLSISQGELTIPNLKDGSGREFEMPELTTATDPVSRVTRQGVEEKTLVSEDGKDILTIYGDHGETEMLEYGLRISSKMKEIWSIDHKDVIAAKANFEWERCWARDDLAVATKTTMTMHCDENAYYVSARLRAFENEACIFDREFNDRISRDA
jgi:putative CocE/NonD family hydrolase